MMSPESKTENSASVEEQESRLMPPREDEEMPPVSGASPPPHAGDKNPASEINEEHRSELDTGQNLVSQSSVNNDSSQSGGEKTVQKFDGKIVYNPDGSAYIIEDGDTDDESLPLPKQEGSITERPGQQPSEVIPPIANAIFVSKSTAYYNALYGQAYAKLMQEKNAAAPETPFVQSYRVFSARNPVKGQTLERMKSEVDPHKIPVKPILMCFICKLSFGCVKSFINHCIECHQLELNDEERAILETNKNTSAIIQNVGKNKETILSFLEPVKAVSDAIKSVNSPPISPGAINNLLQQRSSPSNSTSSQLPKVPTSPIDEGSGSMRPPSSSGRPLPDPDHFLRQMISNAQAAQSDPSRLSPLGQQKSLSPVALQQERSSSVSPALPQGVSPSPSSLSSSSYLNHPTNANMLQGTTIGACPEHINGRPTGVECQNCDLILNRMPGMSWSTSRNSCKTLKCPKCNWHYKYQETLEIHMKEKHPENETTCIYCITGQQHPRLARGETYTCGYKPYRCEVCNYSTTTKGNLSIHMQSDKHLNNMQELQNGGGVPSSSSNAASDNGTKLPSTSSSPAISASRGPNTASSGPNANMGGPPGPVLSPNLMSPSKAKPSWRCDVCNYETNVARNLRIHMTSEKHTHNMMALQQNAKNMHQLTALQQMAAAAAAASGGSNNGAPSIPGLPPGLPGLDPKQLLQLQLLGAGGGGNQSEQAAMADLAFNHALLTQLMTGGQFPPPSGVPNFGSLPSPNAPDGPNIDPNEPPPPEPIENNPKHLFSCVVCREFACDALEQLSSHLSQDRSKTRENEVSIVIGGNYMCQLCNYKTNLKANFQLHCKTDKHIQRLSHVNHIKEGGPANEWKLRFLTSTNPVELRCNACDFYTNSPHKLQVHVSSQQHQISTVLFNHLQKMEETLDCDERNKSYNCCLCKFEAPGKHLLMVHVRSMKHLQMEQIHQLQKRAEGKLGQTEIGDIFQVVEAEDDIAEPEDKSDEKGMPMDAPKESANKDDADSIAAEDDNEDDEEKRRQNSNMNYSMEKYLDPNRPFKCEVCKESFTQKNILLVHYNSVSHLHRLKKSMQTEGLPQQLQQNSDLSSVSSAVMTPEKSPTKGSALEALLGNIRGDRKDDDEVKPYKCNICKVAYSQGSTLDIHMRSVLHQSKASKLQELILTGQVDLSKPLVEQPDPQQLQDQHKKMISDMLSPKSMNSSGSSKDPQSSPNIPTSSPNRDGNSSASPQSSPLANLQQALLGNKTSSPESSGSNNTENEAQNLLSRLAKSLPVFPDGGQPQTPTSAANAAAAAALMADKKASPVLKNLLQNHGFDFIMQFNELNQRKKRQAEEELEAEAGEREAKKRLEDRDESKSNKDIVPQAFLEKFVEKIRSNEENDPNKDDAASKHSNDESSRPPSQRADNRTPTPQNANMLDMQNALQRAMMGAQLQSMNPMMMQMAQLQGLNPLAAMNLHPPLIPPALLQPGMQPPGMEASIQAALLAQLQGQQPNPLLGGQNPQMAQLLMQGGLDPKIMALMAATRQNLNENGPPKPEIPDAKNLLQLAQMGIDPQVALKMTQQQQQKEQEKQSSPSPVPSSNTPNKPAFPGPPPPGLAGMPPSMIPPPVPTSVGGPDPKALLMQQQPIAPPPQPHDGKRARTRITDDQLKILRSNFDINNSPPEESLNTMSQQTGLPLKVIKHWFRNTLFKERQKNKDSPYNFNNPPQTQLNLEEYEKTGESKVTPLKPEEAAEFMPSESDHVKNETDDKDNIKEERSDSTSVHSSSKSEANAEISIPPYSRSSNTTATSIENIISNATNQVPNTKTESSSESSLTLSRLLSAQMGASLAAGGHPSAAVAANNLLPNFPAFPVTSTSPLPTSPHMPDYLTSLANRISNEQQLNRPKSPLGSTSGKRANRTRFTDYQIKVLQEFFENNAYPKDDDLEYLSKLLGLSPRVIVVWFQNARQKARKVYENQPPSGSNNPENSPSSTESADPSDPGRFTRTPGLNYQCKKCLLVFQRYYELIRHQKQHCFKEEDARRSAQAQKAAAQAAAQFQGTGENIRMSEDSNSSFDRSVTSPAFIPSEEGKDMNNHHENDVGKKLGENPFARFMTAGALGGQMLSYPPNSPFGMLQQKGQSGGHSDQDLSGDELNDESGASSPSSKRKLSEDIDPDDIDENGQPKDKRLRTTIQPEQVDFLVQKYQLDSNPSRKMLEQIAAEVGLRKRVVQVWFQNARARERKTGHYKENINDGENHDSIAADIKGNDSAHPSLPDSPVTVSDHIASLIPNSTSAYDLQNSMRKYYEDTMKRFMNDIAEGQKQQNNHSDLPPRVQIGGGGGVVPQNVENNSGQQALDLTSPMSNENDSLSEIHYESDSTSQADKSGLNDSDSNKRFRTQMSALQIKMMKGVFEVYKTPTMTECSNLGREIGLQKRVVQVWFQNARAKEKRAKLQLQQVTHQEPEGPPPPEECGICNYKYSHKYVIQDHIFTKSHLDLLRTAIEQGKYDPESPGAALSHAAAALSGNAQPRPPAEISAGLNAAGNGSPPPTLVPQMLQQITTPTTTPTRELIEMSSRQNSRMLMQV